MYPPDGSALLHSRRPPQRFQQNSPVHTTFQIPPLFKLTFFTTRTTCSCKRASRPHRRFNSLSGTRSSLSQRMRLALCFLGESNEFIFGRSFFSPLYLSFHQLASFLFSAASIIPCRPSYSVATMTTAKNRTQHTKSRFLSRHYNVTVNELSVCRTTKVVFHFSPSHNSLFTFPFYFSCGETDNSLGYNNVAVHSELKTPGIELVRFLSNSIIPTVDEEGAC